MMRVFVKRFCSVIFLVMFLWGHAEATANPDPNKLKLASGSALVLEKGVALPLYEKKADSPASIASLTKLMTAMVVLDSGLPLDEVLDVDSDDRDEIKNSHSRLRFGSRLTRGDMLRLALMSSENRAAATLARHYPGGSSSFVIEMNAKAKQLKLKHTSFTDPAGLSPENVSTAQDLAAIVQAAARYPLIREYTTTSEYSVEMASGRKLEYKNSNRLVRADNDWNIRLQKTGYIDEAGRCLVMLAKIAQKEVIIVLLDSSGKYTRLGDAQRIKTWIETGKGSELPKSLAGGGKTTEKETAKLSSVKAKEPITTAKKAVKKKSKR